MMTKKQMEKQWTPNFVRLRKEIPNAFELEFDQLKSQEEGNEIKREILQEKDISGVTYDIKPPPLHHKV